MICQLCGGQSVRETKRLRNGQTVSIKLECAGCGRLLGYRNPSDDPPKFSEEKKDDLPTDQGDNLDEITPSIPATDWLYISRRLDLQWLPNVPFWSAATITFDKGDGPVIFYRLSPQVLVWLEHAGTALERLVVSGGSNAPDRGQVDAYCEAMETVYRFANVRVPRAETQAAREAATKQAPTLPEHEGPAIVRDRTPSTPTTPKPRHRRTLKRAS